MKKIIGFYRKCDLLTMTSTLLAFIGIVLASKYHYTISAFLLLLCGLCDAFDGKLARKYKYSKEQQIYGVQLDSLSDVIAFGIYPAVLTVFLSNNTITTIISSFYVLCGLVRLAYFNMLAETKTGKPNTYIGVPITTVAVVYPILFIILRFINFNFLRYVMPGLLLVLGFFFVFKIEIPKPDISKLLKKIFNKYFVNIILVPLFIVVGSDLFFKANFSGTIGNDLFRSIFEHFPSFILLYLIILIIFMLLIGLLNSSRKAKISLFTITIILLVINDIKYRIMGTPVQLSDVYFLNPDNIGMMSTAVSTIGSWIILTIFKTIVFIIFAVLLVILDKFHSFSFKKTWYRIITIFLSFIVVVVGCLSIFKFPNKLLEKVYSLKSDDILLLQENNLMYYDYGFFPGMFLDYLAKKCQVPEGYNSDSVLTILDSVSDSDDKQENKWGKANVVFILSEAFTDLTNMEEVKYNIDLLKNIHSYESNKNSMVFDLLVPAYGGASVNTEFEILTGASLSFWKGGFIPYNQYYNNENGKNSPSIIKEFNNNGYTTMYITPWGENSYRSSYVYSLFGTDKTIYGSELKCKVKGSWCSDMDLMDKIYEQLENTSDNNYKFIMAASGENHFPYPSNKFDEYDVKVESSSLSKEDTEMITAYAQGVYDADKSLNYLYQKIQNLDTPTIIVFFGDHLPYIVNNNGIDLYKNSSYLNTEDSIINNLRTYTTKSVILANYDIEAEDIKYINASYLGSYILNKMDLEISPYFKAIDSMRTQIPIFNRNYIYDNITQKSKKLNEMTELEEKAITNYKNLQYYSFYDF